MSCSHSNVRVLCSCQRCSGQTPFGNTVKLFCGNLSEASVGLTRPVLGTAPHGSRPWERWTGSSDSLHTQRINASLRSTISEGVGILKAPVRNPGAFGAQRITNLDGALFGEFEFGTPRIAK